LRVQLIGWFIDWDCLSHESSYSQTLGALGKVSKYAIVEAKGRVTKLYGNQSIVSLSEQALLYHEVRGYIDELGRSQCHGPDSVTIISSTE
jgi:hypothetical protein